VKFWNLENIIETYSECFIEVPGHSLFSKIMDPPLYYVNVQSTPWHSALATTFSQFGQFKPQRKTFCPNRAKLQDYALQPIISLNNVQIQDIFVILIQMQN
jgi:hypothetical protein